MPYCQQEEALAEQPLEALEALAAQSEAALPRVRHAIVAARVAAAWTAAQSEARSEAAEVVACAVCWAAGRDTHLNCGEQRPRPPMDSSLRGWSKRSGFTPTTVLDTDAFALLLCCP